MKRLLKAMNKSSTKGFTRVAFAVILAFSTFAQAQEAAVPRHVELARQVIQNIKPENNKYANDPRYVRFPGDFWAGGKFTVNTDCTGFVEAMLEKVSVSISFPTRQMQKRYSVIDHVNGMDSGKGTYATITKVADLKPGDVLAWRYIKDPPGNYNGYNGHIAFIDSAPVKVSPTAPIAEGLQQWEVRVIDSTFSPSSQDDTRYRKGDKIAQNPEGLAIGQLSGAGSGRYYLYTNEEGNLKAVARAFKASKVQMQDDNRHFAMGRPRVTLH